MDEKSNRIEYAQVCPLAHADGEKHSLWFDMDTKEYGCDGGPEDAPHRFDKLPEESAAGTWQQVAVADDNNQPGAAVLTPGDVEAAGFGLTVEEESVGVGEVLRDAPNSHPADGGPERIVWAELESPVIGAPAEAVDGRQMEAGIQESDAAPKSPQVAADLEHIAAVGGGWKDLPGGSALVAVTLPERHTQAIKAEAEVQGKPVGVYFAEWLEFALDAGWGR